MSKIIASIDNKNKCNVFQDLYHVDNSDIDVKTMTPTEQIKYNTSIFFSWECFWIK